MYQLLLFLTAKKHSEEVEADAEDVTPSKDSPGNSSSDAPNPQPTVETATSHNLSPETPLEPLTSSVSSQGAAESASVVAPTVETASCPPATHSPSTSAPRRRETGALVVSKTAYVIPKKQAAPQPLAQPLSSQVLPSASYQKPPSTQTVLNETRNLLVPPAPSAPSSRPSQPPNHQVRQSIQRSLTSILYKR